MSLSLEQSRYSAEEQAILTEYATRWSFLARPGQRPPDTDDWFCYLMRSGRGAGKTRSGSEWVLERVREGFMHIALIGQTVADVRDTMVEIGPSSILKIARPSERPLYEPSKRRLVFPSGAIATTFSGDEPNQLRGPQFDSCFVRGSMILSYPKPKEIQEIVPGDLVLTRGGFRPVLAKTDRIESVGKVCFSHGVALTGTFDHPIFTINGLVSLGDLKVGDTVWSSTGKKAIMGISSDIRKENILSNTDISGNRHTVQSLKAGISTIKTKIRKITNYLILNVSLLKPIVIFIIKLLKKLDSHVSIAGGRLLELRLIRDLQCAENANSHELNEIGSQKKFADIVGNISYQDLEITAVSVVSIWEPAGRETVYNFSVFEHQEYFTNGILVHNCWVDELAKFKYPEETWDNLEFGLRLGDKPQVFVTTTPRPIKLIKLLLKDKKTLDIRFSTFDNADNLSPQYLQRIQDKYAGTRLGRQELEGEILDDNPNALWQRETIEAQRVSTAPVLIRIITGVDPAVTSGADSDDTGIITGGISAAGHYYILGDNTIHGTPNEWGSEVVKAYNRNKGDRVVGEVNNGGDLVESNLRHIDKNIPFSSVHASRGKQIRAEPIATLYERGMVHHVGVFPELEDQMCSWQPGEKSPDRMDALVWCLWSLSKPAGVTRIGGANRSW